MDKKKKSSLNALFYTLGTLVLVVFVVIVSINFMKDARVFQKPLLSTAADKKTTSGTEGYKTIKYQKPTESTQQNDANSEGTAETSTTSHRSRAKTSETTVATAASTAPAP